MQENERKCKNMKENERKLQKMKETERKGKKTKCLLRMCIIPYGIREPPGGFPFSLCEEQTFSECVLFLGKKEPPREHPRATLKGTARDLNLEKRDKYSKN